MAETEAETGSTARKTESKVATLARGILRLRWLCIVVCLGITVATGTGLQFLSLDTDSRVYFDKDNPDRLALEALEATYAKDSNILIVLAPKSGNIYTKDVLSVVAELTEKAWQTPFSRRVDSLTNFQYSRAEGDDLVISDLVEDVDALTEADLAQLQEIAASRMALYRKIVSEKGDVTAINITVLNPGESLDEIPQMVTFVRQMVAEVATAHPEIAFHLTGGVMIDMAFAEASQADGQTLVPIMMGLIILIIAVSLRSFWGVATTVVVIVMSVVTTMGAVGWSGLIINSSTAVAPVIITTLSVAHSVHLLVIQFHNMREGMSKREAIIRSLEVNISPIAVTSLTTAIGFLTFNFSESPPLRELGNAVAGGVVFAFLYSILFLPSVMDLLPGKRASGDKKPGKAMAKLGDFVVANAKPLFWGNLVLLAVLAFGTTRIVLDDDFIRYFDHRYQFRVDADFTQENLTGLYTIEFSVPAGEEQGVTLPDYLKKLDAFADWYRAQEHVVHVSTVSDIIKRLNENMNADDPSFYAIPDDPDLAAQYLMLYELSMPYGLDLNSQINVAKSASRLTVTLTHVTAQDILDLVARGEQWLAENAPEMAAKGTGMSVAVSQISGRNIKSMLGGTLIALVLISGVLWVVLRNFRIAVVSLAPNLMPATIAFGIWGFLFSEVNLAIAVVVAMTLGIVVDDTVHFLSKYLRARRQYGRDPEGAVRYAFDTVGTSLWVTTAALVVGFGVLATSGFAVNGDMGLLSTITIAVALAIDFLFLPPLLLMLDKRS
ncbi:MAG: efflux RND transporter permease subunit [Magnetospiraceae bacterium]